MAANTQPVFTDVPVIGSNITSTTADTGYGGTGGTAPTTAAVLVTGSTNGTQVEEITIMGSGTVASGCLNVFLFDGTIYWLYDQFLLATQAVSQTALQVRQSKLYPNLIVPNGWKLAVTVTTTQTAGLIATALGGTF